MRLQPMYFLKGDL